MSEAVVEKSEAQKEETRRILQARKDCNMHKDLPKGAKTFFSFVLDAALDPELNLGRRGQVAISQTKLSEWLCCSTRSITTWKQLLIFTGFVWVTKWFMPNIEALDCYHITAIQPKRDQAPLGPEGFWGNGHRRRGEMQPGKGARSVDRKNFRGLVNQFGKPISSTDFSQPVDAKSLFGKNFSSQPQNLRLPAAEIAADNRKNCSSQPQNLRQATEKIAVGSRKNCGSEAQISTPENGKNQRSDKESGVRELSPNGVKGAPSPQKAAQKGCLEDRLSAWEAGLPKNLFLRELEKIKTTLLEERLKCASDDARAFVNRKLKIIQERISGPQAEEPAGNPPAKAKPRPARSAAKAIQERAPTDEEILEGARYLVGAGKTNHLTNAQREALRRVGELA